MSDEVTAEYKYKYVQMTNGVELIAKIRVPEKDATHLQMFRPQQIKFMQNGAAFLEMWLPWAENNMAIEINFDKITLMVDIKEEMKQHYETMLSNFDRNEANIKTQQANPFGDDDIEQELNIQDDALLMAELDGLNDEADAILRKAKANTGIYDTDDRPLAEIMVDAMVAAKGKKN